MQIPLLFSLVFLITFSIYVFFGIYIILHNPKATLNRLFFLVCASLCLWSFGFAIANSVSDPAVCLSWRRVSAVGWTTIYGFLLHYMLLLSNNELIRKRWFLPVLYFFPALNAFVFAIYSPIASTQYHLVKTEYGWSNLPLNNGWDLMFYLYYFIYIAGCVFTLLNWRRKSTDTNIRKQAVINMAAIGTALFLGSLTDVLLHLLLQIPVPQMAPVFTLLPIAAIYYSIKYYDMLPKSPDVEEGLLENETVRRRLFFYLAVAAFSGGIYGFAVEALPLFLEGHNDVRSPVLITTILFVIGSLILASQRLKSKETKELLSAVVILCSIPVVTLYFAKYASITVWAYPLLLIIISLIFNKRTLLYAVTIVSVLTEVLIWILAPSIWVKVDGFDYLLRIILFFAAMWIGLAVNHVYISKLQEATRQIGFQKLISEISAGFLSVSREELGGKIDDMLERMCIFFALDHAYLCFHLPQIDAFECQYEWCRPGIAPKRNLKCELAGVRETCFREYLQHGLPYCFGSNENPSPWTGEEENLPAQRQVKSGLLLPIQGKGSTIGVMGIDSVLSCRIWDDEILKMLELLVNLLADAVQKSRTEEHIEFLAYYDFLTGLPNRTLFSEKVSQAIDVAKKEDQMLAVVFLDLDSFKEINDTMGHSTGDELICAVAESISKNLGENDIVARFGGDEFIMLLDAPDGIERIMEMADRAFEHFQKPFVIHQREFYMTCSAGISVYPQDGTDAESLIKNADTAMYSAKAAGKNQYRLCSQEMKEEVRYNAELANALYRAEERGELNLHYQPQIKLTDNRIMGVEALLRWNHPKFGAVPPAVFIPIAEKNGLINSIGDWVLRTACEQKISWQRMGFEDLRMAVNLSVIQFNNPQIVDTTRRVLKETGLDPKYLELEVTESIAIKELKHTIETFEGLKSLGVSIAIDDFGTEYSSLSRLKMLPADRLKIDMQFVQGIEASEKDQAITSIIIGLAKNLGLSVMAEGVETEAQLDFLKAKLCDDVQGFYFYKPMEAEQVEEILRSNVNG